MSANIQGPTLVRLSFSAALAWLGGDADGYQTLPDSWGSIEAVQR